jgi:hypothetical protein
MGDHGLSREKKMNDVSDPPNVMLDHFSPEITVNWTPPQTMDPCRAKTMRSGRISLGTAPLGDSKLHHLVKYT